MGVFDKFKDMIGVDDYEEEYYDDREGGDGYSDPYYDGYEPEEEDFAEDTSDRRSSGVIPLKEKRAASIPGAFRLVIIEPQGFDECARLVDGLKSRKPIIVNLEKLDVDTAKKIFDFLGGATYALNGNVQKIANSIFVFAPENVDIDAESEHQPYNFTEENEDYNPWR